MAPAARPRLRQDDPLQDRRHEEHYRTTNAGSIAAAQFLQRFVEQGQAWAHLDIAGTAWQDGEQKSLVPSWGVGWGVRLLDRLVADHYEG